MGQVYVRGHRRAGKSVKGYNRSHLARANRYLSLSNRLTASAFSRMRSKKLSPKRLGQLDTTIRNLSDVGWNHANHVMKKKANLQSMMRKTRYGLGYRLP